MRMGESQESGTLADFLGFLWRHRVLIVGSVGVTTLLTIVYVLVVPVQYTAKASLLPQEGSSSGLLSTAMALMGGELAGLDLPTQSPESKIQEGVIKSRRLADLIHAEFDLNEKYGKKKREARLRSWFSRLSVKSSKQGILTVSYRDRDPEFAAAVLSRLLEHLEHFNQEMRSTTSGRVRVFLEQRLKEAETRLFLIEDSLSVYQAENRTLALSSDVKEVAKAGADLLVRRIQLETEVQILRETLGRDAPALRAKEMEIRALDRELARLPRLNSALGRLMRERSVHERTHTFLSIQLEESRMEEARDTPTVDILDPPSIPEEKSRPQRTYTVLIVFFVTSVLSLILARVLDAIKEVRVSLRDSSA